MAKLPDRFWLWLWSALSALVWGAAHLAIHLPRGWPFDVRGEWDLLVTAQAIAAGQAPPVALGAVGGTELGTYLVATTLGAGMALGIDGVLVGKVLALTVGAGTAALITGWAWWLSSAVSGRAGAHAAAGLTTITVALGWPGAHFDLAGVMGRNPESVPVQLLALCFALAVQRGASARWAVAAGVACGLGWTLSPSSLWTSAIVVLLLLSQRPRLSAILGLLGGGLVFFLVLGLVLPSGWEGWTLFLEQQFGSGLGLGTMGLIGAAEPIARPGPLGVLSAVPGFLEGGAHNPDLSWRPIALGILCWVLVAAPVLPVLRALKNRSIDHAAWLGLIALSWLVPLSALRLDRWDYPQAYRYWAVPACLALVVLGSELARLPGRTPGGRPRLLLAALAILTLPSITQLPSLSLSIDAPAATRAQGVTRAGAHALGPRQGRGRHEPFLVVLPHMQAEDAIALAEGYGMSLGADAVEAAADGQEPSADWNLLRPALSAEAWDGLLRGWGCGVSIAGPPGSLELLPTAPLDPEEREQVTFGTSFCLAGAAPGAEGRRFQALDPLELLPARGHLVGGLGPGEPGTPTRALRLGRPDPGCPPGMLLLEGGSYVLGDDAAVDPSQTVPAAGIAQGTFLLESFCIDLLPFPGVEGAAWPRDGLSASMAARLDQGLALWSRRLCTVTELLLAAAGPENWRYPYHPDSYELGACDPDDAMPRALGHYERCISPTGVRDFGVRSAWGRLDPAMAQHLAAYGAPPLPPWESSEEEPSARYASYGGTSRRDTFYRPHNFGIHRHSGPKNHSDDGTRTCMNPGLWEPQTEADYVRWRAGILSAGTHAELLGGNL